MAPDVVAMAEPAMVMTNRSAYSFAELSLKLAVGGCHEAAAGYLL